MRGARPQRNLERAIEQDDVLREGEGVLVACSGGPDSVALIAALQRAKRLRLKLHAAFVNHGLRGSAWQDECVVVQIAGQLEIPLDVIALEPNGADEERLRDARYAALAEVALRRACSVVATAHHAEDQSETVLLALLRGTGTAGLRGMRRRRPLAPNLDLARPFLEIPAETLRAYCHARALPYAVDPTNAQPNLRRNAVREALGALRPLFPGLDAAVARAAEVVSQERAASRRAALRRQVREQFAREDELRDVDFLHVEAAVRALERGGSGTFHMKAGVCLRIHRGSIIGIERT
ncbi:MAG TPA: tRNA lysidine(34) synthetase TilS [Candidatus Babeliales bacterium]|nr:tRNA lysidine(34) synthetase TilS [Candidatus Babeliales bacterium]